MNTFSREEILEAFQKKEAMIHIKGRLVPFEMLLDNLRITTGEEEEETSLTTTTQEETTAGVGGVTIKLRVGQKYE